MSLKKKLDKLQKTDYYKIVIVIIIKKERGIWLV